MSPAIIEWIGYISSIVILISLTMSSIIKLRWINLLGALLFSIYGILIDAMPVALVNFGIVLIDAYYLWRLYTQKENFVVVKADIGSALFEYFIDENRAEIERLVDIEKIEESDMAVYTLRDNNLAGIMIGNMVDEHTLNIKLDFVVPNYRDFKIGQFIFIGNKHLFKERGITRVVTQARDTEHQIYLQKIGFKQLGDSLNEYEKIL